MFERYDQLPRRPFLYILLFFYKEKPLGCADLVRGKICRAKHGPIRDKRECTCARAPSGGRTVGRLVRETPQATVSLFLQVSEAAGRQKHPYT